MPDSPAIKARILFVDNDLSFLQMIRDVFGEASGGAWDIQTATGGGDAQADFSRRHTSSTVVGSEVPPRLRPLGRAPVSVVWMILSSSPLAFPGAKKRRSGEAGGIWIRRWGGVPLPRAMARLSV